MAKRHRWCLRGSSTVGNTGVQPMCDTGNPEGKRNLFLLLYPSGTAAPCARRAGNSSKHPAARRLPAAGSGGSPAFWGLRCPAHSLLSNISASQPILMTVKIGPGKLGLSIHCCVAALSACLEKDKRSVLRRSLRFSSTQRRAPWVSCSWEGASTLCMHITS